VRVLVTGGAGYVGSHAAVALTRAGHDVVVLDDLSTGSVDLLDRARVLVGAALPLVVGDVADAAVVARALVGVDAVVHAAAQKSVARSVADPQDTHRRNVVGTETLLARAEVAAVVFASTGIVYGHTVGRPFVEDDPLDPPNPYAASKVAGEAQVAAWAARTGGGAASLRFFNVVGADPSGALAEPEEASTNLVPVAFRCIDDGRPLPIFGDDWPTPDGTCVRDYVHVADVAVGIVAALRHTTAHPGSVAVNLGTGRGSSVLDVVAAIRRQTRASLPVVVAPRRPGDPARMVAATGRARELFGWQSRFDLDEMVATAWRARRRA
jgi:UDP-glucose 4-epimerase